MRDSDLFDLENFKLIMNEPLRITGYTKHSPIGFFVAQISFDEILTMDGFLNSFIWY